MRPLDEVSAFNARAENIGAWLTWVASVEQLTPDAALWKLRALAGSRLHCTLVQIVTQARHVLILENPGDACWAHEITVFLSPAPASRGT